MTNNKGSAAWMAPEVFESKYCVYAIIFCQYYNALDILSISFVVVLGA